MDGWVESVMTNAGTQIALSATAIIAINFVIHALLSMGLQQLLGMVETLQIILYMPLFDFSLPANTQMFFSFIMQVIAFDIIPTDDFYA